MREIKFRGWDGTRMYDNFEMSDWNVEHLTDPDLEIWKLMQFTSLKDKNGKEIYEGDILKIVATYNNGATGFVVWDEDYPQFSVELIQGDKRAFHSEMGANWFPEIVEIIGNIYENKDLLEVKKCGGEKV